MVTKNISIEYDVWEALTKRKLETRSHSLSDVIRDGMFKKQKVK